MKLALVGLPGSGKTTLLNALTGAGMAVSQYDQKANRVEIKLPDPRLDHLTEVHQPKKHTPGTVRFADLPGLLPGDVGADRIAVVREADALVHVVRAFDCHAYPHPLERIDPAADLEALMSELALADYGVLEKRRDKLLGMKGKPRFTDENGVELAMLERLLPYLEEHGTLRGATEDPADLLRLRSFAPITLKPQLIVVNTDENDLEKRWLEPAEDRPVEHLCAKLEADILDLPEDERAEFMEEMGLAALSRDRLLKRSFELLGLISFFTVGEDECRAWTLKGGSDAVEASACIHDDLARGFIRAEVFGFDDFVAHGNSAAKVKEAGKLRLEGKTYVVQDGDIINVRFSV